MPSPSDTLQLLREALNLSPDNLPLRLHLADLLLGQGRPEEAEREYRQGLALAPDDVRLRLRLAETFYRQGKNSHALVLVEDLVRSVPAPARVRLLHARLLLQAGEVEQAVRRYREAVEADPEVADAELAGRLGLDPDTMGEVIEGRVRASWEAPSPAPATPIERPGIGFESVGGMEAIKEEIRMKIIHPLLMHIAQEGIAL